MENVFQIMFSRPYRILRSHWFHVGSHKIRLGLCTVYTIYCTNASSRQHHSGGTAPAIRVSPRLGGDPEVAGAAGVVVAGRGADLRRAVADVVVVERVA